MRGEHLYSGTEHADAAGSSPHARGTQADSAGGACEYGIIPACAGNTRRTAWPNGCFWDHPRMRGEHGAHPVAFGLVPGSSPHARGTPNRVIRSGRITGIIPACAGNTSADAARPYPLRDHPRMRGEHQTGHWVDHDPMGSSPHARGTPRTGRGRASSRGIIPACAGNTTVRRSSPSRRRDHPRMRGEHTAVSPSSVSVWGSSPHARGTLRRIEHAAHPGGIIPACAGNTVCGGA